MSKKIYFDLDGTLYNLYNMENWLDKLRNEISGVFDGVNKMFDGTFYDIISDLLNIGFEFGVITWLPMQASPEYEEVCRREKRMWVQKYLPFVSEINITSYGIPKQNAIQKRAKIMYLIDDNVEICKMWETSKQRKAINVNNDFTVMDALKKILEND